MNTRSNVLMVSLNERWSKYRSELKTCKSEFSEEAVHDLRVTTRRLLAVMDMLRALDPHPRVQKVRRTLKSQLDSLDDLRDTQVMLADVSEWISDFPDLKPFEEYLLIREKKLLRTARKEIKSLQISELKKRIEKSHTTLEKNAPARGWTARLLSVVDQAYARAQQAFGQVDAAQPASIHRFRITFKKFRYMVEIVHPVLKDFPDAQLKQMHDYQSRMGDVQDAEVFLGALAEFVEQIDASMPAPLYEAFETRRTQMIAKFMDGKEEIQLFWRAAPNQGFSWEKDNEPVHRSPRHRSRSGDTRIRRRQPAPTDQKGKKENGKNRTGLKGNGNRDQSDSDESVLAGGRNSQNSEKSL